MKRIVFAFVVWVAGSMLPRAAFAQQPAPVAATPAPIQRTLLLKQELEGLEEKELHVWVAELAPGASTGRHIHPWHEFVYVLEGALTIEVRGRESLTRKAGELVSLPPREPHEAKNALAVSPTRAVVFGLAPKGVPLVVNVE
jgi:quercetin dioxygenase-like cupin family protein